jgi:hypothetical protein
LEPPQFLVPPVICFSKSGTGEDDLHRHSGAGPTSKSDPIGEDHIIIMGHIDRDPLVVFHC